jgi:hypothetical protein
LQNPDHLALRVREEAHNKVLMEEAAALKKFREAYRGTGLEVRFYPKCVTSWRWQLGCNGGEQFELLVYASTPEGLMEAIKARVKAQARNGQ